MIIKPYRVKKTKRYFGICTSITIDWGKQEFWEGGKGDHDDSGRPIFLKTAGQLPICND